MIDCLVRIPEDTVRMLFPLCRDEQGRPYIVPISNPPATPYPLDESQIIPDPTGIEGRFEYLDDVDLRERLSRLIH